MIKTSEKGSITLFTLIAMIFFLTIAFTAYASAMTKLQAQNDDLERIKASYEQDLTEEGLASLYEEIITNKSYTVTFDANGGIVDLSSKEVKYGKEYGKLPTPAREGYKFMGWNGKNKFDKKKYLKLEDFTNGGSYFWAEILLEPNKTYKASVKRYNSFNGRLNYLILAKIKNPNSSSEWSAISHASYPNTSKATIPYQYTLNSNGILNIGYHYTMTQEYLDTIWNNTDVQIEEGDTATEYEPYYITSNTRVTQKKDHTLTAIWEDIEPPTLELSKETWIEEDFNDWELTNAKVVQEDNSNVLVMGEDGNGFNVSKIFEVNKEKYYFILDAYTTSTLAENSPNGGIHIYTSYLDINGNRAYETTSGKNYTGNGWAKNLELNKWKRLSHTYGRSIYGFDKVKVTISAPNAHSVPPVKIKNFKIYGEAMPNSFYDIKITSSDNVGVTTTKYAKGEQTVEYFKTNGMDVENNQIRVTENGIYTVGVGDKAGNMTVKTIEITNIQ